jgi:hypothetical protein
LVVFLVLLTFFVVLVIRTRKDGSSSAQKSDLAAQRSLEVQEQERRPAREDPYTFGSAGLTPTSQSRTSSVAPVEQSPFDAGELSQRQKDQDDWDSQDNLLQSERFWSGRQSVLLTVVLDYVSALGERSEREVDIRYFQLAVAEDGQQTIHLDGFCHLRNARRYFLAHRAKSITVVETGEVFTSTSDFCDFLFSYYETTPEGQIDSFLADAGADLAEVALYLGRVEGKLKQRAKKVLLPVLAELSGVSIEHLKSSPVCKSLLKVAGTEGKDYRAATKRLLASDSEQSKAALRHMLEELSIDNKGETDDVIAPLASKILNKLNK